MRIALFTAGPLTLTLGAVKNRIEFSNALTPLGWEAELFGYEELGLAERGNTPTYQQKLRDFLIQKAEHYDVVLYEYDTLPFDRSLFCPTTLFVGRPALLDFHLETIRIPFTLLIRLKQFVRSIISYRSLREAKLRKMQNIRLSLDNCDLVQVQNTLDADLIRKKYPTKPVLIIPNGLTSDRYEQLSTFAGIQPVEQRGPMIAFVGTFDFRKGAIVMRSLLKRLAADFPNLKLRLIGTKGLFQSQEAVEQFFPRNCRERLEVIERFQPEQLPKLLADCRLGIFPSYWESFGFGAVEMMAAGLPVIAFRAPGPADFVPEELLVAPGDTDGMYAHCVRLLQDDKAVARHSANALAAARNCSWKDSATIADAGYRQEIKRLHDKASTLASTIKTS